MVTVIVRVVAELDHKYVKPAGAVRSTEPPVQKVVTPEAEIVGVLGGVLTVTVIALLTAEVQPVTVLRIRSENVPAAVTLTLEAVLLSDQRYASLVPKE